MSVVGRYGRWAGVLLVLAVVLAAPSRASAQAKPNPDLGAIVLSQLPGYQISPPGIGMQGPLEADKLTGTPFEDARELAEIAPTFVRTMDGPGLRTLVILAVDAGSPQQARSFLSGAIEGATGEGTATPLPGHEGGVRIVPSPAEADGDSMQQAVFRSGRVVFVMALIDSLTKPVTDADVLAIVTAQSAAVPADVARPGPDPDEVQVIGDILARRAAARESEEGVGRALSYAVAIAFQATVVVLLIVALAARRRAPTAGTAPTAWVAPAPGWGPPPAAWGSPAIAPTRTWTSAAPPAPPAPPAWPPPPPS